MTIYSPPRLRVKPESLGEPMPTALSFDYKPPEQVIDAFSIE